MRVSAKVRTRQPLAGAVVHAQGDTEALAPLLDLIADELNVKRVSVATSANELGTWRAKPNFRVLGPRLGPQVKDVAAALAADDGSLAAALAAGEPVDVETGSGSRTVAPDEVELAQETAEGWGVATDGGITVALELDLDEDLRLEGVAREVIRLVQDARKEAGLDVGDRITLGVESGPGIEAANCTSS